MVDRLIADIDNKIKEYRLWNIQNLASALDVLADIIQKIVSPNI